MWGYFPSSVMEVIDLRWNRLKTVADFQPTGDRWLAKEQRFFLNLSFSEIFTCIYRFSIQDYS